MSDEHEEFEGVIEVKASPVMPEGWLLIRSGDDILARRPDGKLFRPRLDLEFEGILFPCGASTSFDTSKNELSIQSAVKTHLRFEAILPASCGAFG
jgi:hypothetical protein